MTKAVQLALADMNKLLASLEARIQTLECHMRIQTDLLVDYKQQMRYQLTKDTQLARDLGKKKT